MRHLEHKAYPSTGILLIHRSVLSFSKKVILVLKHHDFLTYVVVCNVGDNFATYSLQHSHMRRRLTAMLAPTSIDRLMTYRERFLATETNRRKLILFQFKKLSVVWPVILVFGLLPFFFHRLSKLLFS